MTKILIIENNKEDAKKYRDALSLIGFQTQIAESAIQGLKILNEDSFNLVLLNVMLHDMHGLSLIKKLHNNISDFNTQIIILADNVDDNIIAEAYNLHCSGYLIKSHYTEQQIADYIKTALFLNK